MYRKYWFNSIMADTTGLISSIYDFIMDTKIPKKPNWLDEISIHYLCMTWILMEEE